MAQTAKPNMVYHADWGGKDAKRWCARATLGTDGHYTAFAPEHVGNLGSLIEQLPTEAGESGCAFAGFDFPIGIPAFYTKRAGIVSFRALHPMSSCLCITYAGRTRRDSTNRFSPVEWSRRLPSVGI